MFGVILEQILILHGNILVLAISNIQLVLDEDIISDKHKQRLNELDDSIQSKCVNNIIGTDRDKLVTPEDIFDEELYFEPIRIQSSKPYRNESTNLDNPDGYKGIQVIPRVYG